MIDKLLLVATILAIGAGGGWWLTRDHYTGKIARMERDAVTVLAKAEATARAEEARRTEAVQKEAEDARQRTRKLEIDLAADIVARGLRDAIAGQRRVAVGPICRETHI